jgi:hypothetical protein
MKNLFLPMLLPILPLWIVSCTSDSKTVAPTDEFKPVACNSQNPVLEIPWLSRMVKDLGSNPQKYGATALFKIEHNGQSIIWVYKATSSCSDCNCYYCDGSLLNFSTLSEIEKVKMYKQMQFEIAQAIWKSETFKKIYP